ncbi:L,D-transpeptidase scaffold domain-containing protein [Mucilaginibacter xinganensis]|uniref:Murein L,D-transpeptidase n=1 Tax=Mucilaginibacter xinganensis TaxID=1234841 RepID=A0A223NQM6_9SPHI|nr:L,D-transpeptidase family protein [Mucilaginibacter xinganensis]ASU31968.1 murein L,D-transpeptidase [Mucilaginibacter xinganensis]
MKTTAKVVHPLKAGKKALVFSGVVLLLLFPGISLVRAAALTGRIGEDTSVTANIKVMLNNNKLKPSLYFPGSVKRFYNQRDFSPNWVNPKENTKQTWEAMLLLDCVLQYGLAHEDYHPREILYDKLHTILENPEKVSNSEKARYDILLTDALITFMNHLHFGKLNPEFTPARIDQKQIGFNADVSLANAMHQKDFMSAFLDAQPRSKEYNDLQRHMHLLEGIYQGDCYEIPEADIRKIAINMERLRWMEVEGDTYLHINIPSYTLKLHQPDTTYEFKIIAGKPGTPTPILKSYIGDFTTASKGLVRRILVNKLPKTINENVYQGSNAVNYYGRKKNDAGSIFFWFPNKLNVTLQGSSDKRLFKKQQRAFTDGGIKVENAEKLASLLLKQDDAANKVKELHNAVSAAMVKNFMLNKAVPIKITYVTGEMKDGILISYPDVYNLDMKLEMALYNTHLPLSMK